jgi:hypothetical protein
MKSTFILSSLILISSSNLYANTITGCDGSWDGPGRTTCELFENIPGIVFDEAPNLIGYVQGPLLHEITARWENNSLVLNQDGSLTYKNEHDTFNSYLHTRQFAYWLFPLSTIVGIEDLDWENGDYDYNDFVVQLFPTEQFNVPEPTNLILLGSAFLAFARRFIRRD